MQQWPMKRFEREERAFNTNRKHRMAICATLYQSLSPDLQNRVNQDLEAMQYKARGEAGSLWKFIKEVVQGVGYSGAKLTSRICISSKLSAQTQWSQITQSL